MPADLIVLAYSSGQTGSEAGSWSVPAWLGVAVIVAAILVALAGRWWCRRH